MDLFDLACCSAILMAGFCLGYGLAQRDLKRTIAAAGRGMASPSVLQHSGITLAGTRVCFVDENRSLHLLQLEKSGGGDAVTASPPGGRPA